MWFLQVKCVAAMVVCLTAAPEANNLVIPGHQYSTESKCRDAALVLAKRWRPGRGGYAFHCFRK